MRVPLVLVSLLVAGLVASAKGAMQFDNRAGFQVVTNAGPAASIPNLGFVGQSQTGGDGNEFYGQFYVRGFLADGFETGDFPQWASTVPRAGSGGAFCDFHLSGHGGLRKTSSRLRCLPPR
jgi:hypothetical protein